MLPLLTAVCASSFTVILRDVATSALQEQQISFLFFLLLNPCSITNYIHIRFLYSTETTEMYCVCKMIKFSCRKDKSGRIVGKVWKGCVFVKTWRFQKYSREVDFVAAVVCCFSGHCDTFLQLNTLTLALLCNWNCCESKLEGRIIEQVLYRFISNNQHFDFNPRPTELL